MKTRKSFVAAALAAAAGSAFAQSEQALEPVVVTASRVEQALSDVIPSVSVITREDIERSQAPTLFDLIQGQPGIEIGRNGGPGTVSSIFMRGQASASVAVFIDGVRVQTDQLGNLKVIDIPPGQVERIEILRGNLGALYGEAATGGVIHVFTKAGAGAAGVNSAFSYGSRNTSDLSLGLNTQKDGLKLGLSAHRFETDGYSAMNPSQNSRVNPDDDAYRREGLFLSAEKAVREGLVLGLQANAIKSRVEYDNGSSPNIGTDTHHNNTNSSDLTIFGRFKPTTTLESRLGITQSRFEYVDYTNGAQSSRSEGNQTSLNLSNVYRLSAGSFSFGIDATQGDYETVDAYTDATYDRNTQGYYVGWQGMSGRLDYQVALRHDAVEAVSRTETIEHEADTWLIGGGYRVSEQLRGTIQYSTSFIVPHTGALFGQYGNPNLRPAEHKGYEFGLDYAWPSMGLIRLVRFVSETDNDFSYDSGGDEFANIGRTRNSGYEVSLTGRRSGWDYRFSAVSQDPRREDTNDRLARRARQYGSLRLGTRIVDIDWGAELLLSGDRRDSFYNTRVLGGYSVLNLTASKKLAPEWTGRLKVENAFDKQYQLAYGYDAVPFGVFFSVQYQPK